MKTLITAIFLCIALHVHAQSQPSAREVLMRAKANVDLIRNLSMVVDIEGNMQEMKYRMRIAWMRGGNQYRMETDGSFDENGNPMPVLYPATICVFDGKEHSTYTERPTSDGIRPELSLYSGAKASHRMTGGWHAGLCLDGVLYGDVEDVFTILLRHVDSGAIKVATVTLDGRECVHVTASVREGDYELWLDPAEAYRLRKSIMVKSGEQPIFGEPMSKSTEWSSVEATVTDIDIQEVVGGRLAVGGKLQIKGTPAEMSGRRVLPDGDTYKFTRSNCRFGTTLSANDLALKLPENVNIVRMVDAKIP